jgi:hypothetical protein
MERFRDFNISRQWRNKDAIIETLKFGSCFSLNLADIDADEEFTAVVYQHKKEVITNSF